MIQLASTYDGERVSRVDDLATKEAVSSSFLLQILNELRKAGIVVSRRGKLGGYSLSRPSSEITLLQIVQALEGSLLEADPSSEGASGPLVSQVWLEISASLDTTLGQTTLASMAARSEADMYHI